MLHVDYTLRYSWYGTESNDQRILFSFQSRSDEGIRELYMESDCFVLPTRGEVCLFICKNACMYGDLVKATLHIERELRGAVRDNSANVGWSHRDGVPHTVTHVRRFGHLVIIEL